MGLMVILGCLYGRCRGLGTQHELEYQHELENPFSLRLQGVYGWLAGSVANVSIG
jgi:hypothetical protein